MIKRRLAWGMWGAERKKGGGGGLRYVNLGDMSAK